MWYNMAVTQRNESKIILRLIQKKNGGNRYEKRVRYDSRKKRMD